MKIPFVKAHGGGNDFLFSWERDVTSGDLAALARAICSRRTGVGADGWYLVNPDTAGHDASIRLFNSDGSPAELSGNGTRCAAALLVHTNRSRDKLSMLTGAGAKRLRLLEREGHRFVFEMEMGPPAFDESDVRRVLPLRKGPLEVTTLNVGNPQCVVVVEKFPLDWKEMAAEIEGHPFFPNRTNVSFVRVVDEHTLDVRFYERGAGETLSSGTGSAGAVVAAILRGLARSPVRVLTAAGHLDVAWEAGGQVLQKGPAEIVASGDYYL